ncbi:hypothetical protein [Frondihabitans cladoniiphilus]|uniref:Bacterial Ig domain-containing protein n=1 Tax=Frondihabitans cladoniiphilus TaxID=715785 RepID=A0ABP8W3E1_9MICO
MKLRHRSLAVVLATCIAAPLVVSSSAFAAPGDDLTLNHWGRLVLIDTTDNSYVAIDDDLHGERETDLYDAESEADFFDMPKAGNTNYIANNGSGENIKADAGLPGGLGYAEGSIAEDEFNFEVEADGTVKTSTGKFVGFDDASGKLAATDTARYKFAGSALSDTVSLVASLDEYDEEAGTAELSGTATPGALFDSQIKVGLTSAAVELDGTWSMRVSGITKGTKSLTVEQEVDGDKVDEHEVSLGEDDGEEETITPVAVTSAQKDGTYTPGQNVLTGTGTAGDTVSAKNVGPNGTWAVNMGSAKVDTDGNWSLPSRNWGPANTYYVVVTQTHADGSTDTASFTSAPDNVTPPVITPVAVTSSQKDGTYTPGQNVLTGTGTAGDTVSAKNVGPNGTWAVNMGSAKVDTDGNWSLPSRNWGPANTYYVVVTQTHADGSTDTATFTAAPDNAEANVPVAVTSISDGDAYSPGQNVLKGTGTKGASISAKNVGPNGTWAVNMGSAKVDTDGNWSLPSRNWGPSNEYWIKVTQVNPDQTTSEQTVHIIPGIFQALELTSPAVGDKYTAGTAYTFEGKATPGASVTVRSALSTAVYFTVKADDKGEWSKSRQWGPTNTYKLIIEQSSPAGSDKIENFVWAPSK